MPWSTNQPMDQNQTFWAKVSSLKSLDTPTMSTARFIKNMCNTCINTANIVNATGMIGDVIIDNDVW